MNFTVKGSLAFPEPNVSIVTVNNEELHSEARLGFLKTQSTPIMFLNQFLVLPRKVQTQAFLFVLFVPLSPVSPAEVRRFGFCLFSLST